VNTASNSNGLWKQHIEKKRRLQTGLLEKWNNGRQKDGGRGAPRCAPAAVFHKKFL
jgi:hypothetical protein